MNDITKTDGVIQAFESTPTLADIYRMEDAIRASGRMIEEPPVEHYFGDGVYVRKLIVPGGIVFTGKMHKKSHVCIMLYGNVDVVTDGVAAHYEGPCIFESPAGTKRAFRVYEETCWATAHGTHETDLDALEIELIYDETPRIEGGAK